MRTFLIGMVYAVLLCTLFVLSKRPIAELPKPSVPEASLCACGPHCSCDDGDTAKRRTSLQQKELRRQAVLWLADGHILSGYVIGEVHVEAGAEVTFDKFGTRTWKHIQQPVLNQSAKLLRFETPSLGAVLIEQRHMLRIKMLQPE